MLSQEDINILLLSKISPFPESEKFEVKECINNFDKCNILPTVCAFLNRKGGTMVFGINDKLKIVGLNITNKVIDTFKLKIDNIFHKNLIIGTNNEKLIPEQITCKEYKIGNDKYLIILQIKSNDTIKYKLSTGEYYVRINASNQSTFLAQTYSVHEITNIKKNAY